MGTLAGDWLPAGHMLGDRYRIEEPIGAGGFGQVYRAVQLPLERHVAVKVLPPAALASADRLARFEREAELAQRLEHPNTVRMLDYGVSQDGAPFLVMELLRGEALGTLLDREGGQSVARTAIIARDVLKSLMEAHALGIVHRDVKPANIFLTAHAGEPLFARLLDFGVAKRLDPAAPESLRMPSIDTSKSGALTHDSQVMGTPRYMAPEQVAGETIGPPADLYALGLTLAETLTGRPVYDDDDPMKVCLAHMSEDAAPLPSLVTGSALGAIIGRAVAKRIEDRFASAEEMLHAIEAMRATLTSSALHHPTAIVGGGAAGPGELAATQATPPLSRRLAREATSAPVDWSAETERTPPTVVGRWTARWKVFVAAGCVAALASGAAIALRSRNAGVIQVPSAAASAGDLTTAESASGGSASAAPAASASAKPVVNYTVPAWPYAFDADEHLTLQRRRLLPDVVHAWPDIAKHLGFAVERMSTAASVEQASSVAIVKKATCVGNVQVQVYADAKTASNFGERLIVGYEGQVPGYIDGRTVLVIAMKGKTREDARKCHDELSRRFVLGP